MIEKKLVIGDVLQAYQDFLAFFPLKYCKSKGDYDDLIQHMNALADQGAHVKGHVLHDLYLISLLLLDKWEKDHLSPILQEATGVQLLTYLMNVHCLKQKDLADCATASTISAFLNGRRSLSKEVAKKLAKRFNVRIDAFLR